MPSGAFVSSAGNQIKNLLGKCDYNAVRKGQETVGSLAGAWLLRERPTCTMPKPSIIRPIARISPKINVDRLLTTLSGSFGVVADTVVTPTVAISMTAINKVYFFVSLVMFFMLILKNG